MKESTLLRVFAQFIFLFFLTFIHAQDLSLEILSSKIVEKNNSIELISADNAQAGDKLMFSIFYKNQSKKKIQNAEIVDPIPQEVILLKTGDTQQGCDILFSADNGKSFHFPPLKPIKSDEKNSSEFITQDKYTHIKWVFQRELTPGEMGVLTFETQIK